ncbi:hypothetical protein J120_04090 [candidate division TM6 bacterium JCVI TM6SC1]|jgi:hypothetical protein|uniref:Uncharacterized protein n=1 Tax=candidate division TM6 bacterium JCVI TM6SC1 TaxID=1306947 RepID=A0A0D2JL33_9BACT|nr:hypothetical protein J120_04090 [candidate division TM6 bacterium JCVI TM6SC1]
MKRTFILFYFICAFNFSLLSNQSNTKYQEFVDSWINSHTKSAGTPFSLDSHDARLLINVIYFSYLRSVSTCHVQHVGAQALTQFWQLWHNMIFTRRNPSKQPVYNTSFQSNLHYITQAIHALEDHAQICTTYAHALELVLKGPLAHCPTLITMLENIRHNARTFTMQGLLSAKEHVYAIYNYKLTNNNFISPQSRSISDVISNCMSFLRTDSLVEADRCIIKADSQIWKSFQMLHTLGNHLYVVIETIRSDFYWTLYQALYTIIEKQYGLEACIMVFDAHGYKDPQPTSSLLPAPEKK